MAEDDLRARIEALERRQKDLATFLRVAMPFPRPYPGMEAPPLWANLPIGLTQALWDWTHAQDAETP